MRIIFSALLLAALVPWRAEGVTFDPVALPGSEPAQPVLFFNPAELPALQARRTNPVFSAYYNSFRNYVNGQLAGLAADAAGMTDDTLVRVAKGAGLLGQLGETPAASFPSYRDAAVTALKNVRSRTAWNGLNNPSDKLDVLQDAGRLQSMVEAYDFLRGTGVASADDQAIRATIAKWAEAMRTDVNLAGAIVVPGHRDNWGMKGGSALVTAALGLCAHPQAGGWLSFGRTLIAESLNRVASNAGWWREGPHYLNYTLNNLVSTAAQVKARTGVDWFKDLRPFVLAAMEMRQPDGSMTPFEEGLANVFPFDVLASRYPDVAPTLSWAWEHSAKEPVNYDNQQFHEVTRFLLADRPVAAEPTLAPTRFLGGDAHVHVLRSDWSADALQATMITAVDHDSSQLTAARHHMQNPLDFVLSGAGKQLLVTSGGGPTVTSSPNRSYYLQPSSRNVPLVNGSAPYIVATDAGKIRSDLRLDSRDDGARRHRIVDLARTNVTSYGNAARVSRLLAMVDDSYVVVADELAAGTIVAYSLPFRGRGTRVVSGGDVRWDYQGAALDLHVTSPQIFQLGETSGSYASAWNTEEAIQGIEVRAAGATARILTLLRPRASSALPLTLADRSVGDSAALQVTGTNFTDRLVFGPESGLHSVESIETNATFSLVRESAGAIAAFAMANGTRLARSGSVLVESTTPVTLSVTLGTDGLAASLSQDQAAPATFSIGGLAAGSWVAFANGVPLPASQFAAAGALLRFTGIAAGTNLRVESSRPPTLAKPEDRTGKEGELLEIALVASDPDGTPLEFSVTSNPPVSAAHAPTIASPAGLFRWTPGPDAASTTAPGRYELTFTASDGFLTASASCVVTVENANVAPLLVPPGDKTVEAGEKLTFQLEATDADGDALTYAMQATPAFPTTDGPQLAASTGAFEWTPPATSAAATYEVTFSAFDGEARSERTITLRVTTPNRAPVFTTVNGVAVSDAAIEIALNPAAPVAFDVVAIDADGDAVLYGARLASGLALPEGAAIDATTGHFTWSPAPAATQGLRFAARDPDGAIVNLDVTLRAAASTPAAEDGCGCQSGAVGALAFLPLLLLARRRRS